ncbi:MAG: hypothetical protein IJS74_02745 [Clostridia bacterium]|nr:hypothetical protein [Clostridia bacterium]
MKSCCIVCEEIGYCNLEPFKEKIKKIVEILIQKGIKTFKILNSNDFSSLCTKVIEEMKSIDNEIEIADVKSDYEEFSKIKFNPFDFEKLKFEKYLIDKSDACIFFVNNDDFRSPYVFFFEDCYLTDNLYLCRYAKSANKIVYLMKKYE